MINFKNIGKHSYAWDILMPYYRFALNGVFFKECVIVGRENIPSRGTPVFVIANHQNSINDGLVIVSMFKDFRQPVALARGDFFKNNIVAKILRFWRVMPTFRAKDGGASDIKKNMETFQIAAEILKKGGTITMFPEAMHQQRRILGTFKKGVPRICFGAEEAANYQLNLQILPVNLHYSKIQKFREKVLIEIGKPFGISEMLEAYKSNPNEAYLQFNNKARAIFKEMVLNIEDAEQYEEYNFLREMIRKYRIKNNYKRYNYYDEFKEEKKVIAEIDALKEEKPEKFETLMAITKEYSESLRKLDFRDWLVNKKITGFKLVMKKSLLVILSPFFLFGFANNAIPCFLVNYLTDKIPDRVFVGSLRFIMGFMLLPLWYIAICAAASLTLHSFMIGISYTILAFLSLFVYYEYKINLLKFWHEWRYFFKRSSNEVIHLRELKKNILSFFKD
jgi:1-acyl-sn-glycerol-3-phosphate acyltransferase